MDTYAQDLKCLFYKAYPSAQQSTLEMQELMKSVLTNQFVCGLQPELKGKLAGRDGHFEQLLTIARFEEAKARELQQKEGTPTTPRKNSGPPARTLTKGGEPTRTAENQNPGTDTNMRCFDCGQRGHRARNCPEREQRRNKETPAAGNRGRDLKKKFVSAAITREENSDSKENSEQRVEDLRRQLQEAEVELALEKQSATMRGVTCDEPGLETVQLGPTVCADLELGGCRVKALVDTGSPATIVSLEFLLNSLAKGRAREQTPTGWKLEVKHRIKPPEVTLRSYGGGGLDIVGQILVTLRCGSYSRTAVVLVQKQAPEELLLGTDLQPYLGFRLLQDTTKGATVELLKATDDQREADNVSSPTVVHLLHAKRLTPHHGHVVRAKVDPIVQGAGQLFVPLDGQPCNWEAEDGLVEVMEDGTTTILRNPTGVPIHLQEGDALGQLQTVEEVNVQGGRSRGCWWVRCWWVIRSTEIGWKSCGMHWMWTTVP